MKFTEFDTYFVLHLVHVKEVPTP